MKKRIAQVAGLTLLLGIVFVPSLHASPRFSFSLRLGPSAPIAPYGVAPSAPSGYIWQPGYYVQTPFGARWVEGAWIPAPYVRSTWGADQWAHARDTYSRSTYDPPYDRGNYDRNRKGQPDRDVDRNERGNWRR
jgi:hypothetical protein